MILKLIIYSLYLPYTCVVNFFLKIYENQRM
uniref:Uncharacterized protein n=1 Tax=Arundo donax TaxID=35708 RepID=A0A0A9HJS2_ARUDO